LANQNALLSTYKNSANNWAIIKP